ncbi:Vacuolar cation/proton exchanger 2 [Symbiodinium microadriaticum]|uniref:Vacuolar cation/proton exchanger 2 n=1 Tax=Symbiodinium microadriaticum TaxID=2951 RepID=A0A1Q9EZM3_SYMMI|nr:Vacuolar cation/proton exchanger 2 [Symbiodinium microadriaticum]
MSSCTAEQGDGILGNLHQLRQVHDSLSNVTRVGLWQALTWDELMHYNAWGDVGMWPVKDGAYDHSATDEETKEWFGTVGPYGEWSISFVLQSCLSNLLEKREHQSEGAPSRLQRLMPKPKKVAAPVKVEDLEKVSKCTHNSTTFMCSAVHVFQKSHAELIMVNTTMVVAPTMKQPLQRPSWLKGGGNLEAENRPGGDAPLWYSRFVAVAMLVMYGLLIFFQLGTHTHLFEEEEEDGEEEEPGLLGFWGGVTWLGIITVFISLLSEWIVDTIEGAATSLGMPILFISGILVPIVGNAAEHAAAVVFAYRNKMEIALGSAVGSAVQISVFVIPLCVVLGWCLDKPTL